MTDLTQPAEQPPRQVTTTHTASVTAVDATITTVDHATLDALRSELVRQFTDEIRNLEKHLSTSQATLLASYDQVIQSQGTLTGAISKLTAQVEQMATDRAADAAFIASKRTEDAARLHEAELEAARKATRAEIVMEQQALAKEQAVKDQLRVAKRNRLLLIGLSSVIALIVGLTSYLITGSGNQTGTSRVLVAILIGVFGLFGFGIAILIKPMEGV